MMYSPIYWLVVVVWTINTGLWPGDTVARLWQLAVALLWRLP